MLEQPLETSIRSIDEQIAEAKERATAFHQSLQDAKVLEKTYMHLHDKETLSLEREKQQFELERQKWSKSLAEKNSVVQQLERELSSTITALHQAVESKSTLHELDSSACSSSSSVAHSHSPSAKKHIYYDEDGRRKDDRKDGNKTHRVEHRRHVHDYSSSSAVKHDEERGLYGSWVPAGTTTDGSKHVVSDKHLSPHHLHHHHLDHHSHSGVHHNNHHHNQAHKTTRHSNPSHHHPPPAHYHHEKETTIDPVIPLVQQSLHKDIADCKKENRRLKDDFKILDEEVKMLRAWRADAEGKLKFRLDQVLGCESQILMLKSQVTHLTDLNRALVDTIEVNEKLRQESLLKEQELKQKELDEEATQWMSPMPLQKKNITATAPPKKKTTASKTRSKQPKESSLDAELAPPIVTTVELLAAAKAAFDVSENMIGGKYKLPDPPTELGDDASSIPMNSQEQEDDAAINKAMKEVNVDDIVERVKRESKEEVDTKATVAAVRENDDESVKSKVSVTGSIASKASKGSTKSIASKGKAITTASTKKSSMGSGGSLKPATFTSARMSSQRGASKAPSTSSGGVLTRRSNLASPPTATSPSMASYARPPTIPTSRKASIPKASIPKTKTKKAKSTTSTTSINKIKSSK